MKLFNKAADPQDLVYEINDLSPRSAIIYPLDYHNRICVIELDAKACEEIQLYYCSEVNDEDYNVLKTIDNSKVSKDAHYGIYEYWDHMDCKYNPIAREVDV